MSLANEEAKQFLNYLLACAGHDAPFDLPAHVPRIKRILEAAPAQPARPLRSCDLPPQSGDDKKVGNSDVTWGEVFGRKPPA
jgi:hypothetical protein